MKLKILILCVVMALISVEATKSKAGQLFEVVYKELDKNRKANSAPKQENTRNLFDSINFSQVGEKVREKEESNYNASLFETLERRAEPPKVKIPQSSPIKKIGHANAPPQNPNTLGKLISKVKAKKTKKAPKKPKTDKNKKQLKKNEKEIKNMKKKVQSLLQMNDRLVKKMREDKGKKAKLHQHVESFIQKYDKDVYKLKKNLVSSQNLVSNKIGQKDQEFKKVYQETAKTFNELQTQVHGVDSKIDNLIKEEDKKITAMQSTMNVRDLNVKNKVEVEGIAFVNKVSTNNVTVGNVKIDTNQITFLNEDVKIAIGKEVTTIGQLMKDLGTFNHMMTKCGKDFENCRPVSEELLKEQVKKQELILENLKNLRTETNEVLSTQHHRHR